ncbi:MAG: TIGR02281 family clan AA aspartic protease [Roseinatronobacter sp.]
MLDGDDIARLVYLTVLGTVLIGYLLASRAQGLGQTLRHAVLWGLLFVGVAAGYSLWQDVAGRTAPSVTGAGTITVPLGRDGHFHLTLEINGTPVRMVVDTGASNLVLSQADAARVGLDPARLPYLAQGRTANGVVGLARVVLRDVVLRAGDLEIRDRDVSAFVTDGAQDVSLLGMGYLRRFARISIEGDRLVLER